MKNINVIFDLDGTITDSSSGILTNVKKALQTLGYEVPDDSALNVYIGPSLRYGFTTFAKMKEEDVEEAVKIYRNGYDCEGGGVYDFTVYEGFEQMLKNLAQAGANLTVASAKPHQMVEKVLNHSGIIAYLSSFKGAGMSVVSNDKTDIIRSVMQDGVNVMVGDTLYDVQSGKNAGCAKTIAVTYGFGFKDKNMGGADYVAHTVKQLEEILLEIIKEQNTL